MSYRYSNEEIAEYFNREGFPPGPLNRTGRWTGPAVVRFFKNTILFGRPFRNEKITVKNYESGKRRAQKNPEGRIEIDRPDLAFLDAAIEPLLKARFDYFSGMHKRDRESGDPLRGVARNRSRFPGHCLRCWYCGREYVWGANGQRDRLMCGGSRLHQCWNSTGVEGAAITRAVTKAIIKAIRKLPSIETQIVAMLDEARQQDHGGALKVADLERQLADNKEHQSNLASAIARRPDNEALMIELERLETDARRLMSELGEAKRRVTTPALPQDLGEIIRAFKEVVKLKVRSYELAALLRPMVVSMDTHLIRLIDSNKPIPRTRVELNLLAGWPDAARMSMASDLFTITLTVDNKSSIPQRCRYREVAVRLVDEGRRQRDAAAELGVTQPVVDRACRLTRMMNDRGLDTPFVPVMSPDELGTKHRRHRHQRYQFQPLDGYVPRPL